MASYLPNSRDRSSVGSQMGAAAKVDSPTSSALERAPHDPAARTTPLRRVGPDVLIALLLLTLHTIAVWSHISTFWGDIGRWSHEVERLALGELPYRDFQWHYPPLGLWVEGGLAALIGTERAHLLGIYNRARSGGGGRERAIRAVRSRTD